MLRDDNYVWQIKLWGLIYDKHLQKKYTQAYKNQTMFTNKQQAKKNLIQCSFLLTYKDHAVLKKKYDNDNYISNETNTM